MTPRRRKAGPGWRALSAALVGFSLGAGAASAEISAEPAVEALESEWAGRVFEDLDSDGRWDSGEPWIAGVAVHNGRDATVSESDGSWSLPAEPGPFVVLSRPEGFVTDIWFVEPGQSGDPIDFALRREAISQDPDGGPGTFFIHYTDAHVYERSRDFLRFSAGPPRLWVPELYRSWLLLRIGSRLTQPRFTDDLAGGMRAALAPHRDVSKLWDMELSEAWLQEFTTPGSPLAMWQERCGLPSTKWRHCGRRSRSAPVT